MFLSFSITFYLSILYIFTFTLVTHIYLLYSCLSDPPNPLASPVRFYLPSLPAPVPYSLNLHYDNFVWGGECHRATGHRPLVTHRLLTAVVVTIQLITH